jgi:hypothetical protein
MVGRTLLKEMLDLSETKTVFVKDNKAVIICPCCEMVKSVNVEKFKGRKKPLTVRCKKCGGNFSILLDFRASYHKKVHLDGYYTKFGFSEWNKMEVKDISRTGIQITTLQDLKENDEVAMKFTLDNMKHSEIKKNAVVRWTKDRYAGLEFTDTSLYESELGFYLLSG